MQWADIIQTTLIEVNLKHTALDYSNLSGTDLIHVQLIGVGLMPI